MYIHQNGSITFLDDSLASSYNKLIADNVLYSPLLLSRHFQALASLENSISSYIRKKVTIFSPELLNMHSPYIKYLKIKTNLISQNLDYLIRLNQKRGLFRYGFYL